MKQIFFVLLCVFFVPSLEAQKTREYSNPILAGFYPDPSICKVGGDYYLTNSTFAYFPGLPIFHSTDLANWKQIGFALDRPGQLDLEGAGVSRGLFAPDISFHQGIFYIVCTFVDKLGNFVITARNPAGPWSDPVALRIDGIDPSLFFDDSTGEAYLIYNSVAPDNKPLYEGHRTLRMRGFDPRTLQVTGEEKMVINGGTDISKKPVWIEGPHIFKKDGYYYLIAAEGGTAYNHSEVVFRSRKAEGPYEPYNNNPILTQRQLNPARAFPVTTTGHADFTQAMDGSWYAVFLGCRPYGDNYYNTGRETFMAPVTWTDGWPVITSGDEVIRYVYPMPRKPVAAYRQKYSGNFVFTDPFNSDKLNFSWQFLRTPVKKWYSLQKRKGWLAMDLQPLTCSGTSNPSFLGWRQAHQKGYAATSLEFNAQSENEKAGMLVFQNEHSFYYLCRSVANGVPVIELYGAENGKNGGAPILFASLNIPQTEGKKALQLKIEADTDTYSFYYAVDGKPWELLKGRVRAEPLSTKVAGGFVGCLYALYATSSGNQTNNVAYFDWFKTVNKDYMYK